MEQPRHDMYTAIHKALRRRIFETTALVEGCDFADAAERTDVLGHVRTTLECLEEHAGHEDDFVLPRLQAANPAVAERLTEAHERVHHAGAAVAALLDALEGADADVALSRGPELCHALNLLASQHLEHMNDEETLANAVLWQAHTDEELRELHDALLASIPGPRMAEWMAMMLPALNVHERIGVMGGIKANAPAAVFEQMMQLGHEVVGTRWDAVQAAVG